MVAYQVPFVRRYEPVLSELFLSRWPNFTSFSAAKRTVVHSFLLVPSPAKILHWTAAGMEHLRTSCWLTAANCPLLSRAIISCFFTLSLLSHYSFHLWLKAQIYRGQLKANFLLVMTYLFSVTISDTKLYNTVSTIQEKSCSS